MNFTCTTVDTKSHYYSLSVSEATNNSTHTSSQMSTEFDVAPPISQYLHGDHQTFFLHQPVHVTRQEMRDNLQLLSITLQGLLNLLGIEFDQPQLASPIYSMTSYQNGSFIY